MPQLRKIATLWRFQETRKGGCWWTELQYCHCKFHYMNLQESNVFSTTMISQDKICWKPAAILTETKILMRYSCINVVDVKLTATCKDCLIEFVVGSISGSNTLTVYDPTSIQPTKVWPAPTSLSIFLSSADAIMVPLSFNSFSNASTSIAAAFSANSAQSPVLIKLTKSYHWQNYALMWNSPCDKPAYDVMLYVTRWYLCWQSVTLVNWSDYTVNAKTQIQWLFI